MLAYSCDHQPFHTCTLHLVDFVHSIRFFTPCFTVPKKNTTLHFIQDLQPINKVKIQNAGIGPTINEFMEAFARRSIYAVGTLYSGYDHSVIYIDAIEKV